MWPVTLQFCYILVYENVGTNHQDLATVEEGEQ